ncbi:MAG: hypothetical protein K0R15_621 [Clostridiales bacterium]|jgi:hypothetical protein|nr:hypothetical protein [Clostridiales bacterium]
MYIYIDESGSMTHETTLKRNKSFIICLLLTDNPDKLKKIYKRFVAKYLIELKSIDIDSKMFKDNDFVELKGCCFTSEMKRKFVDYFCKNDWFKLLYINIDNEKAENNFYKNKARAFNYVLKLAFEHLNNISVLTDRVWYIQVDERNVKTDARYNLEELFMTEFITGRNIADNIQIQYFDSSNNKIIQLSDVFSNLFYSNIMTDGVYESEIQYMIDNGYLIKVFKYPPIYA